MSLRKTFIFSENRNSTWLNPCNPIFSELLGKKPVDHKVRSGSYSTGCSKSIGNGFPFISTRQKPSKHQNDWIEPSPVEVIYAEANSRTPILDHKFSSLFRMEVSSGFPVQTDSGRKAVNKLRTGSDSESRFYTKAGVIVLITIFMALFPQDDMNAQPLAFGEGWMIGLNAGAVTFLGTLSHYENGEGLAESFRKDSDFGMSYMFGKMISRGVSVRANYLSAHMKGSNASLAYSFKNKLDEVSLNVDLSLLRLFIPRYLGRIDPYLNIGGGFLQVDTYRERIPSDFMSELAVNESAMFLTAGLGIKYELNTNWKIDLYGGMRATDSGLLDATIASDGVNDMYSWISAGIVYVLVPAASGRSSRGMPCPDW